MHGNLAHAHWFAFLAPFFLDDYDVVSLSNSGNGQSGWRQEYSFDAWGAEVIGVVSQETYLIHGTVRENLLFARLIFKGFYFIFEALFVSLDFYLSLFLLCHHFQNKLLPRLFVLFTNFF